MTEMTQEQANEMFLAHSICRQAPMNTPDGTTYTAGKQLRFTAPILPGWAAFIRVETNLTATVTLNTGTVAVSAAAPYNVFQSQKLSYGGTEHRNHHPYGNKLIKQTEEHDGGFWNSGGPSAQAYAATLFTGTPVAAGANVWNTYFDVPLQINHGNVAGLLPMGASASPITLELNCASAFAGTDPFLNPVVKLGDGTSTVTVTGTVTATVYYRYAQSPHDPRMQLPTPAIGMFAKITQMETPVSNITGVTFADLRDPYPLLKAYQIMIIPGAAAFVPYANLAGAQFDLDSGTPYKNYTTSGAGFTNLLRDQRNRYGQDLDAGVVAWDFVSGSDPKHPDGVNAVNIAMYNAARAGIHFNGTLASASNRIVTMAMFVETLPF